MTTLLDAFEKLITEHGSSAILRDRIELLRDQAAAVEKDLRECRTRCAELEKLKSALQVSLHEMRAIGQFVEHRGGLFKRKASGGFHEAVYCPSCRKPMFSLDDQLPYDCASCQIILDFNGSELPSVLEEVRGD